MLWAGMIFRLPHIRQELPQLAELRLPDLRQDAGEVYRCGSILCRSALAMGV